MKKILIVRRVRGHSMDPTLHSGQIVIASGILQIKKGRIVIARRGEKEIIKRVGSIRGQTVELVGDNANSAHDVTVNLHDVIATKIF